MFNKIKKLLLVFLVIFFSVICLNVSAENTNNFDYEIELNLNGKESTFTGIDQMSNLEQANIIYEYYNNHENNQEFDSSCVSVFDSNFYSSIITNFVSKFFYIIIIGSIVVLTILTMTEFVKAITSDSQDSLKIAFKRTLNRFLAVTILIFTPLLVSFIVNLVNRFDENGIFSASKSPNCNFIRQNKVIDNNTWGIVNLDYAEKSNNIFLGWTTNKNGPSIIFKSKVDTSLLLKEKVTFYSLFINSSKDKESYNGITLHNRGEMFKNINLTKSNFIKSTSNSGFNYFADFDEWYYLSDDGNLYTGIKKINNKTYYFGKNGALRFGWVKIDKKTYYFNTRGEMVFGEQVIGGTKYNFDEKTGALITHLVMNYSSSVEVPESLWRNYANDPSVVIVDESGKVIASRKPNVRRAGASTTKLFTGYAAVKLLDVNKDKVTGKAFAHSMSEPFNSHRIGIGESISVSRAAVMSFPNSSNETAESIPIAIGYKYYKCSSDKDAHSKGMKKINEFIKSIGCTNSNLENGSGLGGCFAAPDGLPTKGCTYGHSANDLAFVAIAAMNDANFVNAFVKYSSCENGYGSYPKCRTLAKDRNVDGLFFIKSGTGGWSNHGIWAFNKKGKHYYMAILGVPQGRDKFAFSRALHDWAIKNLIG